MRLSTKEQSAIKDAFTACFPEIPFELYLFGSRVDDSKKGGDIDLLLLVPDDEKKFAVELKSKVRIKIFEKIPEQKIDITVATKEECKTDEFLQSIMPRAHLLLGHIW